MRKVLAVIALVGVQGSSVAWAAESPAALQAEAKVKPAEARKTALGEVPGKIKSEELEREKGKLIYSYDIKVSGKPGIEEVQVDAITGEVVSHEHESSGQESGEQKSEAPAK